jgi:FHA domain-containing protein
MGDFNPPHPVRKVAIPDHLWEAFEEMARQMGSERDGLINQALFMFARLNGFLEVSHRRKTPVPAQPTLNSRVAAAASSRAAPLRSTAAAEAVAPTIGTPVLGKGDLDDLASLGEVDTGAPDGTPDDPLDILDRQLPEDEERSGSGGQLYLMAENGALDRIGKDRFVIGRGKHCDFIINSGKVSREHAVIVRDDGAYYIEDLGSSNGTWFNKQRIKRKQVEDGDEFFICNEKIKLVLR